MKKLAIALLAFSVPMGAMAQTPPVTPGYIPPNAVPSFNNLGGTLSGINTGNNFTIGQVQSIPIFHGIGNTELLKMKARDIVNSATPGAP